MEAEACASMRYTMGKVMRIEFVTDTFPPDINGVAMTLGRFVDGLRERGHLVHVYHTADRPKQTGETPLPSIPLPGYKEVRMGLPGRFKLFNQWKTNTWDSGGGGVSYEFRSVSGDV